MSDIKFYNLCSPLQFKFVGILTSRYLNQRIQTKSWNKLKVYLKEFFNTQISSYGPVKFSIKTGIQRIEMP